jgi:hypothetical protein
MVNRETVEALSRIAEEKQSGSNSAIESSSAASNQFLKDISKTFPMLFESLVQTFSALILNAPIDSVAGVLF